MSKLSDANFRGIPMKAYDMVREGLIVLTFMTGVIIVLAGIFGFPKISPLTLKEVATKAPIAFMERTFSYFSGESGLQTYGPPYTKDYANAQRLGAFCPACWTGVAHPLNAKIDLVMKPLQKLGMLDPAVATDLQAYDQATPAQQKAWTSAYAAALKKAKVARGKVALPAGDYGPVPGLMNAMLTFARSGLLESALVQETAPSRAPYNTDYTRALLYLGGPIMGHVASHFYEQGGQWGMSHSAGPYPGAWWLWPYTFLYQIPAIGNSPNADLIAGLIMAGLAIVLIFLPVIPGLNRLPEAIPVYKIIWRDWYERYPSNRTADRPLHIGHSGSDKGHDAPA